MKKPWVLDVATLVLATSIFGVGVGCGETDDRTAGTGGTGGVGGSGGGAGSEAPVITKVQWQWPQGDDCKAMTGAVTLSVSATDNDTGELSLNYSGSVSDCTPDPFGDSVTVVSILTCDPDSMDYSGTVTVTDPDNNFDTVSLEFQHCRSGQVCEGGNPCE